MIVYISGPITGVEDDNAPVFDFIEKKIKEVFQDELNLEVINPIRLGKSVRASFEDLSKVLKKTIEPKWEDYMRRCIAGLSNCTHILFLDGWENSKGAKLELQIAIALNIPCFFSVEEMQEKLAS